MTFDNLRQDLRLAIRSRSASVRLKGGVTPQQTQTELTRLIQSWGERPRGSEVLRS